MKENFSRGFIPAVAAIIFAVIGVVVAVFAIRAATNIAPRAMTGTVVQVTGKVGKTSVLDFIHLDYKLTNTNDGKDLFLTPAPGTNINISQYVDQQVTATGSIINGKLNKQLRVMLVSSITPSGSTGSTGCLPRPHCLDLKPACLISEPAGGWCPPTSGASSQLPWIHIDGTHFADSSNKTMVFRGFVFIAGKAGNPYNTAAYATAKSFGANYQSIKMQAFAAGYGSSPNQKYLDELSQMVQLAESQNMYTDLKLTVYDIPGFDWTAFWRNQNGEQEKYLTIWAAIWQRFASDPGVIAFDLLNEPEKGSLPITNDQFQSQYLTPFYEKAVSQLRSVDQKHIAFFQPQFNKGPVPYTQIPNNLAGSVYAPHFYPSSPDRAVPLMTRFIQEAATAGTPLFIGEYGALWQISNDGNTSVESQFEQYETADYNFFKQYGISYSRPWFADDRVTSGNPGKTWSIFKGTTGNLSNYRTWIIRPFAAAAGVTLP